MGSREGVGERWGMVEVETARPHAVDLRARACGDGLVARENLFSCLQLLGQRQPLVWYRIDPDPSVVIACLSDRQDPSLAQRRALWRALRIEPS